MAIRRSSKLDLFEGFVKKVVTDLQKNPKLWASTAIFVTVDEGGGYYDSGYIQPLDFFWRRPPHSADCDQPIFKRRPCGSPV